ncbi:MAG: hypothetical protein QM756_19260 [Polyangiaceae bacterium]
MALTRLSRIAGALVFASSVSCNTTSDLPGTALGSFALTAVLSTNTCGDNLSPANPWKFDADMSLSDNTLYFRPANEDAVSAPLDSDRTATCTTVVNSASATNSTCTLSLKRIYTVQLDSATAPKTSSGSLRFEYSALSSSTCYNELSANGGSYEDLPCAVEYLYTALKQ